MISGVTGMSHGAKAKRGSGGDSCSCLIANRQILMMAPFLRPAAIGPTISGVNREIHRNSMAKCHDYGDGHLGVAADRYRGA